MTINASHILVKSLAEAEDLISQLESGATFEALALQHSQCPSGQNGGNLGTFSKGMMVKPFEDAAYSLDVGQLSAPVQTQFGYHLIKRNA